MVVCLAAVRLIQITAHIFILFHFWTGREYQIGPSQKAKV